MNLNTPVKAASVVKCTYGLQINRIDLVNGDTLYGVTGEKVRGADVYDLIFTSLYRAEQFYSLIAEIAE